MAVEQKIIQRIEELLASSGQLSIGDTESGNCRDQRQVSDCIGWLTAVVNIVELVCPNLFDPYRKMVQRSTIISPGWGANRKVDEVASVLRQLLSDINNGLISSVVDQTVAETFDDFLDHAEEYLKDRRKDQAGVIAGVVFEDTIRRICRKKGVGESGRKISGLLDELTKAQVLTSLKTKRAKSAAHVRTKATHAQWEEFDASDVEAAIKFTRELLEEHLA